VDAPFAHHPAASAVVAIAVAIVALGAPSIARQAKQLPGWRDAWPLIGLGPGLVAFLILSGNLGQVIVGADLDFRAAGLALAIGAAVGIVWTSALIRARSAQKRVLFGVAAVVLVAGCVLFDAGSPAAGLGAAAVAAALLLTYSPHAVAPTRAAAAVGAFASVWVG